MRQYITGIFSAVALILSCNAVKAQDSGYDVFNPIAKYITQGDAEKLSAWFSDNLEVTIFSDSNDSSRKFCPREKRKRVVQKRSRYG